MSLKNLEIGIGYEFKDKSFLEEAMTHRSYLHDHPKLKRQHNERLEFLGDAVLELAVTQFLYNIYPEYPEGKLTSFRAALVNYQMLAQIGREINLGDYLFLSRGEAKNTERAREVILANAMEALIGAIYKDGGVEPAFKFVEKFVMPRMQEVLSDRLYKDAKSLLQEKIQEKDKMTPHYEVLDEIGPDHDKVFKVAVFIGDKKIGVGTGPSKQEAETEAAKKALEKF